MSKRLTRRQRRTRTIVRWLFAITMILGFIAVDLIVTELTHCPL